VITIIDYGAGNLKSVVNAIIKLGFQPKVTSSAYDILSAKLVILPGVGAAGDTMENLKKLDLVDPIRQYVAQGRPFLGICIGLQVLFTHTEEGGGYDCLNIIPGQVRRLPEGQKVPQIGWNQVKYKTINPIFTGIPDLTNFYFVHSYYADPDDKSLVIGETEYGIRFCSAVAWRNLVAVQFHPEKSGDYGLKIYDNFIKRA
jgi:imidazole glycerol-phosphate synthase subunit HisH